MRLSQALEDIITNKQHLIRRADWPAIVHVGLIPIDGEGRLMIFDQADNKLHPWTICESDMVATDWEVDSRARGPRPVPPPATTTSPKRPGPPKPAPPKPDVPFKRSKSPSPSPEPEPEPGDTDPGGYGEPN